MSLTRVATSMIALTALGPGGFSIDLESKLYETISVKDFGARGNGTTDDTAAIQAAITYGATHGATIRIPRGTYKITSTITIDESATTGEDAKRMSIRGEGMNCTVLKWAGSTSATMLYYNGPEMHWADGSIHAYSGISDLSLEGGIVAGVYSGIAFSGQNMAYWRADNILIRNFDRALQFTDTLSCVFSNVIVRGATMGFTAYRNWTPADNWKKDGSGNWLLDGAGNRIRAEAADQDYQSGPNNLTFLGCTFSACKKYAMHLVSGTTLTFLGGSIENNGVGGPAERWGVKIENSGVEGGVGCTFVSTYFEHNVGDADVIIEQGDPTGSWDAAPRGYGSGYTFLGCTFNRLYADDYTNFNIWFKTSVNPGALTVMGCGFLGAGAYVPDPTRPCIQLPTSSAARTWKAIQEGNWFSHPNIDAPVWSKTQTFSVFLDGDQTVPTATPTLANFRKASSGGATIGEDYGNNWRDDLRGWTAPFDIRMSFSVKVQYNASLVAGNYAVLELRVNNVVTRTYPLVSNGGGALLINADLNLKKNDLVQVVTTHSAGADRVIYSGVDATYFTGHPI